MPKKPSHATVPLKMSLCINSPAFKGHQVHAVTAADIASRQPVHLQVLGQLILPGEEVVVTLEICMTNSVRTILVRKCMYFNILHKFLPSHARYVLF